MRELRPYRTKDGVWCVRVYLGKSPVTGRVVRPYRQFPEARSEEEAKALAEAWASTLNREGNVRGTLVRDLARDYIDRFEKMGKSPNTSKTYRTCLRWVDPYIGDLPASEVTSNDISDLEWVLLTRGGRDGRGIAASSVQIVHCFLSSLWKWMARAGVVEHNVVQSVDKPRSIPGEAAAFGEKDVRALSAEIDSILASDAPKGSAGAFAAWLSLRTGMRCGEVCALRICDFVEATPHLHVCGTCIDIPDGGVMRRGTTKSRKSRNVSISRADASVVRSYISERRREASPEDPLLDHGAGWPSPDAIGAEFRRICRSIGLVGSFHTLRHTHATWLLAKGIPLKTVSTRLGHARPSITMNIYAHALPGDDDRAAGVMDSVLGTANGLTTGGGGA